MTSIGRRRQAFALLAFAVVMVLMTDDFVDAKLQTHTFRVGSWQCSNYLDIVSPFVLEGSIYADTTDAHIKQLMDNKTEEFYGSGNVFRTASNLLAVKVPFTILTCSSGSEVIVVDGGIGSFQGLGTTSELLQDLRSAGFRFEAVTHVFNTHLHLDHFGILDMFPNALVYFAAVEQQFWQNATEDDFLPYPSYLVPPFIATARELLASFPAERLQLYIPGEALPSLPRGISLVALPGHTPGNIAVQISSGGQTLLHIGDVFFSPANALFPDVVTPLDTLQAVAIDTRRNVLTRLRAAPSTTFIATHFPWPGLGRFLFGPTGTVSYQPVLQVSATTRREPFGEQLYLPTSAA